MFRFVVRNEQHFKNLHGVVGNKERRSDKNFSTLLPINSLKFRSFLILVSSGDLIFFFGRHDLNFGQHDSGFGQHDFGRLDSKPLL